MQGVESRIFSGDMLCDYDPDDLNLPGSHTFLIIKDGDDEYIWDSTNPIKNGDGSSVFLLLKPVMPFSDLEDRMSRDCLMVECHDVIRDRCVYYGVGDDGTLPAALFVHAHNDGMA